MTGFMAYIVNIGQDVNLDRASRKLSLCSQRKGGKVCGMHEEFHITMFKDGEIWVEFLAGEEQHRQLMRVANFLGEVLREQGIETDFTNLLLNGKALNVSIPPSRILHSNPREARKILGASANINLFRLMLHYWMANEAGDKWKDKVKEFGNTLGALAYYSAFDTIKDDYGAIEALKNFMKSNGIGVLNQITPGRGEIIRLMIDESLTSSGTANTGRRLCYLESGIISGFFSKFYKQKINCEEEKCWGLGNDHCEFSVQAGEEE